MVDALQLGIAAAEPQAAVTPKKARLDSPCSPLSQSSTVSSTQVSVSFYEQYLRGEGSTEVFFLDFYSYKTNLLIL